MADAENRIVKIDKNKVNISSAFTPDKDLVNTFNELLFRPNLNIRVSLNSLKIRKNRPSSLMN